MRSGIIRFRKASLVEVGVYLELYTTFLSAVIYRLRFFLLHLHVSEHNVSLFSSLRMLTNHPNCYSVSR